MMIYLFKENLSYCWKMPDIVQMLRRILLTFQNMCRNCSRICFFLMLLCREPMELLCVLKYG